MNFEQIVFLGTAALVVLVTLVGLVVSRGLGERRARAARERAVAQRAHLPASMHPIVDPAICIGSLSCIRACPEGDILGVIDGAAALIEGANCIGHGRCAAECPVDAIKLVFGTSERGIDLPEVDGFFESSRPGVHIVGELAGMGLIKNAITQGLQVAETLAGRLGKSRNPDDVLVVGAGPAGLATAVGLRAAGVSFRIVDQGPFGGTMASYPRQKVVMTEPVRLPLFGRFGKSTFSKEQLLESWRKVCAKARVDVESGVKVEGIDGSDGDFTVRTNKGPYRARKIVLAIGRRGTPRRLGVEGEELPKVTYGFVDPDQYHGRRVLVVGGGDSAIEAACALAATPGTEVTLSYRGPQLQKCRRENQARIAAAATQGAVRLVMASEVVSVTERYVRLRADNREEVLPNDYVIACTGGELPGAFLAKAGISMERHFGDAPTVALARPGRAKSLTDARRSRWLVPSLWIVSLAVVAVLAWVGRDYYVLSPRARRASELHEALRPGGVWGHGVGIVATLFMLSNFLYAVRKRLRIFKRSASIRSWLSVHMIIGFMSPLVIAFHAAFQWNNLVGKVTFVSLLLVVGAGIVGRFIYGLVPRMGGVEASTALLEARWQRDRELVVRLLGVGAGERVASALLRELASHEPRARRLTGLIASLPLERLRVRCLVRDVRRLVTSPARYGELRDTALEMSRLRGQMAFNRGLQRLLSGWRLFHVTLSVLLVFVIVAHIGVSIYIGYTWLWR